MRLGVSIQAVKDTLYDAFGQRQISTIFGQSNQYRVVLEADPSWQADPHSLRLLRVPGTGAELRRPLGIAIIGGPIVSQLLTLYTTPIVYPALERLAGWRKPIVLPAE